MNKEYLHGNEVEIVSPRHSQLYSLSGVNVQTKMSQSVRGLPHIYTPGNF